MRGKVLLGWMTRDRAVKYLGDECLFDPPLTQQQAEALWEEKKAVVEKMGPRPAPSPKRLEMTAPERETSVKFISFARRQPGGSPQIQGVIKVDPQGLACQQLCITLDQANAYTNDIHSETWAARNCLATQGALAGLNYAAVPNGWNFNLPHGEFQFVFNGQVFGVTECAPYISVCVLKGRTVLWSGYHRCYARIANADLATMDSSVLAVVRTNGEEALSTNPALRDQILGDRPPLLGDFLDDRFCMEVEVRRMRYQLQVRAEVAKISAE